MTHFCCVCFFERLQILQDYVERQLCLTKVDLLHWLSVMGRPRIGCLNAGTTTDESADARMGKFQHDTYKKYSIPPKTRLVW